MSVVSALMVGSACVSSAGVFGVYMWRRIIASQQYSYSRCPACRQRIRFLTHKAGRGGQCPRCWKRFTLTIQENT